MLHRAAQARAFLEGRDYCLPDDFKQPDRAGVRAPRGGQLALRLHAEEIRAGRSDPPRNPGHDARSAVVRRGANHDARHQSMRSHRWWQGRDRARLAQLRHRHGGAVGGAGDRAVFRGRGAAGAHAVSPASPRVLALGMAAWVAITIVPALARRTSLRWIAYQVDYRLTREGMIYLARGVRAGSRRRQHRQQPAFPDSGLPARRDSDFGRAFAHRAHRHRAEIRLARAHLRRAAGAGRTRAAQRKADVAVVFAARGRRDRRTRKLRRRFSRSRFSFRTSPRASAARQKVELRFPRRGVYRQDASAIRTRFPFGFFREDAAGRSRICEIVVYPRVEPTDQFYEVLPLLTGEMASFLRGRGHELHSLREYVPTDSARFVDWKVTREIGAADGARIRARGRAARDAGARSVHRAAARRTRPAGRRRTRRAIRARRGAWPPASPGISTKSIP